MATHSIPSQTGPSQTGQFAQDTTPQEAPQAHEAIDIQQVCCIVGVDPAGAVLASTSS